MTLFSIFRWVPGAVLLGALVWPVSLPAQEGASPEARLREALRQLTVRVQTAEAEAATLKAGQAASEAKVQALQASLDKTTKEAAAAQAASEKSLAAGQDRLAGKELELGRTREALEKWKAAHAQVTELGRKSETARVALAEKAAHLQNQVADLTRKNLALWKIGEEVLTRLENFSYGTALAAREPFVGATRVRLENEIQGYKDKLLDPKLKP